MENRYRCRASFPNISMRHPIGIPPLPRQLSSRTLQRNQNLPSSQFRLGRIVIDVRGDGCGGHFSYVMSRSNINTSCVLSVHVNTGRFSSHAPLWKTSSSTSPTLISATVQFPSSSATREMTRASNRRSVRSLLDCEYRSSSSKSDRDFCVHTGNQRQLQFTG